MMMMVVMKGMTSPRAWWVCLKFYQLQKFKWMLFLEFHWWAVFYLRLFVDRLIEDFMLINYDGLGLLWMAESQKLQWNYLMIVSLMAVMNNVLAVMFELSIWLTINNCINSIDLGGVNWSTSIYLIYILQSSRGAALTCVWLSSVLSLLWRFYNS
jgi:hypothetical protein